MKDADKDMVAQLSEEKPVTAQNSTEDEVSVPFIFKADERL